MTTAETTVRMTSSAGCSNSSSSTRLSRKYQWSCKQTPKFSSRETRRASRYWSTPSATTQSAIEAGSRVPAQRYKAATCTTARASRATSTSNSLRRGRESSSYQLARCPRARVWISRKHSFNWKTLDGKRNLIRRLLGMKIAITRHDLGWTMF